MNDRENIINEIKEDEKKGKLAKMFKWNMGQKMKMNKSTKKPDEIVVWLLNLKKQMEGPVITKIYGGNFIVIRNHVYRYSPSKVFTMGKWKNVIAVEGIRDLVGVDNYQKFINADINAPMGQRGNLTNINDPVLIKALIQAKLAEKPPMGGMKWIIIILAIVGVIVGFFLLSGKLTKKPVDTAPTVVG